MKQAIALSVLSLVCIGTTVADVGRIPIYEPVLLDAGAGSIDGHYYVTRDVDAPAGTVAIDILGTGTENIEIDLNGFTVSSSSMPTIRVGGGGLKSLTLVNGFVERSSNSGNIIEVVGIASRTTEDLVIDNLRIRGRFPQVPDTAVHVTNVNKIKLSNNIIQRVHTGIFVEDTNSPAFAVSGRIERNHCNSVDTVCINLTTRSAAMQIAQNTINFVGSAIVMQAPVSARVVDNSIQLATGDGLKIEGINQNAQGVHVAGNTFNAVGNDAIALINAHRCMLIDNVISDSDGDGIYISGGTQHQLERNLVNGNAGYGLHMDGTAYTVYRNNTFRRNDRDSTVAACTSASPCDSPAVCDVNGSNNLSKENIRDAGECP